MIAGILLFMFWFYMLHEERQNWFPDDDVIFSSLSMMFFNLIMVVI